MTNTTPKPVTRRTFRERVLIWLSRYTRNPIILNEHVFTTDDDPVDDALIRHFETLMKAETQDVKLRLEESVKKPDYVSLAGVEFRYVEHGYKDGRVFHKLELLPGAIEIILDEAIFNILLRKK